MVKTAAATSAQPPLRNTRFSNIVATHLSGCENCVLLRKALQASEPSRTFVTRKGNRARVCTVCEWGSVKMAQYKIDLSWNKPEYVGFSSRVFMCEV